MPRLSYTNYLNTPHWQETRRKMLEIVKYQCEVCTSKDNLQVHHIRYEINGVSIRFEETENDLLVLCGDCHFTHHKFRRRGGGINQERLEQVRYLLQLGLSREDAFFRGLSNKRYDKIVGRIRNGLSPLKSTQDISPQAAMLALNGERKLYREKEWRKAKSANPQLLRSKFRVEYPDRLQKEREKRRKAKQNCSRLSQ